MADTKLFPDGSSPKTLKTASFDVSGTGSVVTAVVGKKIKVYAYKLNSSAAIKVSFRDGASTALEASQNLIIGAVVVESVSPPASLFCTSRGSSLDIVLSGAGNVSGRISYWDDDAD